MALNLDVSELTQTAAMKPTAHDNCIVLDLGTGGFPRDIEVRLPDDDGARQNALWDGSLNLAVDDEVLCFEYSGISAWRVMAMGGNDGGAGKARVSEVWESDFGNVTLQSDADGNIGIGTAGPDAKLDVSATAGAQLRLTFEDEVKFANFTLDTNHDLTIKPSSTGQVKIQPTTDSTDFFQILDADGGIPVFNVDSTNERVGIGIDAPEQPLHIIGAISTVPQVRIGLTSAGYVGLYSTANNIGGTIAGASHDGANFIARTTTPCFFTQVGSDGTVRIFSDTGKTVGVAFTPTERMRISPSGFVGIGTVSPSTRLDIDAGALEFAEMTAPAAGAANTARLYAVDNGAGKTQLVVVFNTGAPQVLATQP